MSKKQGRPKLSEETTTIGFVLPKDEADRLKAIAPLLGYKSHSALLRDVIAKHVFSKQSSASN